MARLTGNDDVRAACDPAQSTSSPVIVLSRRMQAVLAVGVFSLSAWLTVATVSYVGSRSLLMDRADYISDLEQAYDEVVAATQTSTEALLHQVESLERETAGHSQAIGELRQIQAALEGQLASRERQLRAVLDQRDHTRAKLDQIEQGVSATKSELKSALEDKVALAGAVRELEEEVRDATQQRDSVRRAERALRWQVARLESQLQSADQDREVAQLWFKDWVAGNVASLQELFVDTGIDLEVMVARAVVDETGAGGPLQGVDAMNGFTAGQSDPITSQIRRLSALQKLASSMPLASPLDHFHVTSHYGKRSDPFTKRLAFHGGLDLGAAPGSTILATAPGRVVHAGISGPYGNMVEIDHGMGVSTRYGHLKSINVEMMQEIDFRQEIGVIGSTGRSTARHLHYEIRIDGKAYNPAKFLEAGRFLVDLFNFKHAGADGPTVQQTVTPAPKPKG
jgi:murein DD-endopeptidase MepM/ murein hydrolase activator NlpD